MIAAYKIIGSTAAVLYTGSALAAPLRVQMATPSSVEGMVVPPHLSFKEIKYFESHPDEFKKLLARLPKIRKATAAPQSERTPAAAPDTWVTMTGPASGLGNPLLLTDGEVIVHVACTPTWYKLRPNYLGDYTKGTWSQIASMPNSYGPLYFASQILSNGNVIVNGGEYSGDGNGGCYADFGTGGALYNPVKDSWSTVAPPSNWGNIGDAQSIIRFDGTYMLANSQATQQAFYNQKTGGWTDANFSGKYDVNDEEGWVFLPDGRMLTVDSYTSGAPVACGKHAEQFAADGSGWSALPDTSEQLSDCSGNSSGQGHPSHEVGPVVLRADGSVVGFSGVQTGDYAGTSIFSLSTSTWVSGPHVPYVDGQNYNLGDAPATVTPDGNIVFAASPGYFKAPTHFFAYTPDNQINQLADVPGNGNGAAYLYNMITLPTGQVLMTDTSNQVYIYTPPTSAIAPKTRPQIINIPTGLTRGQYYRLEGRVLNGITQGSYGDDQQAATNFPLVRITNNATGRVTYAHTRDFSNRSIQPNHFSTANVQIPYRTPTGASTIAVIANGVPSYKMNVTIY